MKTPKEIADKHIHDVEKGIDSCEDRVCDVSNEIIYAMEEYAQLRVLDAIEKFGEFCKSLTK